MVLAYNEAVTQYGSLYKVKQAVQKGELFKLSPGLYSIKSSVSEMDLLMARYKGAIFTMDSAFYFWGLTNDIPDLMHVATGRRMTRISMDGVKQYFESDKYYGLGKTEIVYNGSSIRCYDRERMMLELVRYRNKLPFDYYKEIVESYRGLKYDLDFSKVDDYIEAMQSRTDFYEVIQREIL